MNNAGTRVVSIDVCLIIRVIEDRMFEKCALAKALENLQKRNWIERLPGDTVQWVITETGRYYLANNENGHQAFELLGQTPN